MTKRVADPLPPGVNRRYSELSVEDIRRPDNSRKGPPIGLGSAWSSPEAVRARSAKAEAAMRLAMAGRRFSIGEPGDRGGAKPARPEGQLGWRSSLA